MRAFVSVHGNGNLSITPQVRNRTGLGQDRDVHRVTTGMYL